MTNPPSASQYAQWVGRTECRVDQVTAAPLRGLWAILGRTDASAEMGAAIPALGHWLYFTPVARQSELGEDGHPVTAHLMPPAPLPRRMWAGACVELHRPLHVAEEITRESRILDVSVKEGRSGSLVFLTPGHEITTTHGLAIRERQHIVYRTAGRGAVPDDRGVPAPIDEAFRREVAANATLLFRYSALTFNAHRIHYDRTYATEVEGYRGLVVQGPLIATMLIDLLREARPDVLVRVFSCRALSPCFVDERFSLCGRAEGRDRFLLWARDHAGVLAMQATAEVA